MNVAFLCPKCQDQVRCDFSSSTEELSCPHCGQKITVPPHAIEGRRIRRCLVCPSTDLFVRKDFPQRLGVAVVILGFAASCVAWAYYQVLLTFAILFATALIDVVLYVVVGDALMCYRCHAQYRDVEGIGDFGSFDLETHERHRQMAARLKAH